MRSVKKLANITFKTTFRQPNSVRSSLYNVVRVGKHFPWSAFITKLDKWLELRGLLEHNRTSSVTYLAAAVIKTNLVSRDDKANCLLSHKMFGAVLFPHEFAFCFDISNRAYGYAATGTAVQNIHIYKKNIALSINKMRYLLNKKSAHIFSSCKNLDSYETENFRNQLFSKVVLKSAIKLAHALWLNLW